MASLDPILNPSAWDVVKIGGDLSPGLCKLSGFKREFGWQIKKGKGAKGSTVTLNEYPPVEGTITFQLWEPEHWDQWENFGAHFAYDPTKKPIAALEIYHPSLDDIGIRTVVCKSIGAVEHMGNGLYQIVVTLIEYNPPPKAAAVATPDHAEDKPQKPAGNPPDPIAAAQQKEISRLLDEASQP